MLQKVMSAGSRILDASINWLARASGAMFFLLAFYITADAIGRKLVGVHSRMTNEMSAYTLAVGATWALAYTFKVGGHIRIDVLLRYIPLHLRIWLEYITLTLMMLFAFMLSFYSWDVALESLAINSKSMGLIQTPIYVPQILFAFGFSILALKAAVELGLRLSKSIRDYSIAENDSPEIHSGKNEGDR